MKERYYGWLGIRGYDGVVKVINNCEAYVYNKRKKFFERDDDYLKAAFDPGSDFDEITKDEAMEIIGGLSK